MKGEIDKLTQSQAKLVSQLKTIGLTMQQEDCSTEVIFQRENLQMKLSSMTQNAKRQIDAMVSLAELEFAYMNRPKKLIDRFLKTVKFRIITEKTKFDPFTQSIINLSAANGNPVELKQLEKLPFNLTITDDKEAAWGEPLTENENPTTLWTNDPTQITILKTAFESVWQKASKPQPLKPNTTTSKHHTKQHEKSLSTT